MTITINNDFVLNTKRVCLSNLFDYFFLVVTEVAAFFESLPALSRCGFTMC